MLEPCHYQGPGAKTMFSHPIFRKNPVKNTMFFLLTMVLRCKNFMPALLQNVFPLRNSALFFNKNICKGYGCYQAGTGNSPYLSK